MKLGLEDIKEGLNVIAQYIDSKKYPTLCESLEQDGTSIIEDRMKNIGKYPYRKLNDTPTIFFASNVITGKTLLITKDDVDLLSKPPRMKNYTLYYLALKEF